MNKANAKAKSNNKKQILMRTEESKEMQDIDYSELFDRLLLEKTATEGGEEDASPSLDGTVTSFLYYLFPNELFVRALSLLESKDMFIYVYTPSPQQTTLSDHQLLDAIYGQCHSLAQTPQWLYRMVTKEREINAENNNGSRPVLVDLERWFCSCAEYSEQMHAAAVVASSDRSLVQRLNLVETDPEKFREDKFAQLDSHSLSQQRYFKFSDTGVCCVHLLAYALLLRSASAKNLHRFAESGSVLLVTVASADEWLRLHINVCR